MPETTVLVQVAIGGLLLGAVYSLLACGLNLIYGVMRVINVAHGELMMLGAYTSFWLFSLYGLNPILSLVASLALLFLLGALLQRFIISRVVGAPELTSLLLTFGLSIVIMNLALYFWSADFRSIPYLTGSFRLGPLAFPQARMVAFGLVLFISGGTYLFLKRATLGKAIRATSQHADMAMVCGIDVGRVRHLTFGIGSSMAGAAGSLLVTLYAVNPEMGPLFILKAFAIIVLGGMGSFVGAFFGGLLLGLAEAYASLFLTAQLSEAVAYLLLVIMLLVKPAGLWGAQE